MGESSSRAFGRSFRHFSLLLASSPKEKEKADQKTDDGEDAMRAAAVRRPACQLTSHL